MHYKDGTEARVGDIVRGRGYNLKYDIVGPVTELLKGDTCNIRVLVKVHRFIEAFEIEGTPVPTEHKFEDYNEAGAMMDFELVARIGWSRVIKATMAWERDPSPV